MNKRNLFVLLPMMAIGACAQPESAQDTPQVGRETTTITEAAVTQTVVLDITGAS